MENDDTQNNAPDTSNESEPSPVINRRSKKGNETKGGKNKTGKQKKKSFKRSWGSSGPVARWTLIFVGITAAAGTLYFFGL